MFLSWVHFFNNTGYRLHVYNNILSQQDVLSLNGGVEMWFGWDSGEGSDKLSMIDLV